MFRRFFLIIQIVITALLFFNLAKTIEPQEILSLFSEANPFWIMTSLVLITLSNFIGAKRWHIILISKAVKVKFVRLLKLYYMGAFFSTVLPGAMGGDFYRIYAVSKDANKASLSLGSVVAERLIGFWALLTVAALCALFAVKLLLMKWIWLFYLAYSLGVALLFFSRVPFLILNLVPFEKMKSGITDSVEEIQSLGTNFFLMLKIFFISFLYQFCQLFAGLSIFYAFGVQISAPIVLSFLPVISIVTMLPLTPGGVLVREQAYILLFGQFFGLSDEECVTLGSTTYLCTTFFLALIGGVLFLVSRFGQMGRSKG